MKNTINLTKIYFKETISRLTSSRKSLAKGLLFLLLIFVLVAFSMGYSFYGMATSLEVMGNSANILYIGLLFSTFVVIMMTVFDTQGYFYDTKDFEMLSALPIKITSIVTAKYLSSYLISFIYNLMIAIPAFVVYFMFEGVTAGGVIMAIVSLIFLPAFTQLIGSLLAWLINIITSKLKNKNIMRTIISILFLVVIFAFVYGANSTTLLNLFSNSEILWLNIIMPHIYLLFNAMTGLNIWFYLGFLLVSILFAAISVLIVSFSYKKINTSLNVHVSSKSKKPLSFKQSVVVGSLLKKEAKTFFTSPIYCINGLMGPILCVVMTFILISIIDQYSSSSEFINMFIIMSSSILILCAGIAPTTAVSISFEGSKFFVLKSLPIKYNHIVLSKLLFNLILNVPFVLISEIIFWCFVPFNFVHAILMFVYTMAGLTLFATLGLLLNLKMPKLNWTSEAQAVKQGGSMISTMFIDIFVSLLPLILAIFIPNVSQLNVSYILMSCLAGVEVVAAVVVSILLFKYGKKVYYKIQ